MIRRTSGAKRISSKLALRADEAKGTARIDSKCSKDMQPFGEKNRVSAESARSGDPAGPQIFGIVNLTEDSFSDGGRFLEPGPALEHARRLAEDGAHVLDLGPASSHPDSADVSPEEERRRLAPVLEGLAKDAELRARIQVSVDSFHPETQRFAIGRGADFLNDITGFSRSEFYPELADSNARLVLMHSLQGGRADRQDFPAEKIFDAICGFFEERLHALQHAGVVVEERVILDPGMGFFLGSRPEASFAALARVADLKRRFALPVLVSVSRKSFLGAATGRSVGERGAATLAAELFAAEAGADFIRTHDVRALLDALRVRQAIAAQRGD